MKKIIVLLLAVIMIVPMLSSCSMLFGGDNEKNTEKPETTPAQTTPEQTTAKKPEPTQPDDEFMIVKIDPINVGEVVTFPENTLLRQWNSIGTTVTVLKCVRTNEDVIYLKTQINGRTPYGTPNAVIASAWIFDAANKIAYVVKTYGEFPEEYSEYNELTEIKWSNEIENEYASGLLEFIEGTLGDDYDENAWYIVHNGVLYDGWDYEIITDLDKQAQKEYEGKYTNPT